MLDRGTLSRVVRPELQSSFSGFLERGNRPRTELGDVLARGAVELDGCQVVMGERLRTIFGSVLRERIDPLRHGNVTLGARRARKLSVRRIADECVDEGVLHGARDGRPVLPADELLALERVERARSAPMLPSADREQGVRPDALPSTEACWRSSFSRLAGVDPRGDDPLHRVGELPVDGRPRLEHARELLRVERITRRAQERALRLGLENRAIEQGETRRRVARRRAAPARSWAHCACRHPSPGAGRAARAARCRRRAAARPPPSRRGRRRSRAGRRRPSGGPRTTSTVGSRSASASKKRRHAANASAAMVLRRSRSPPRPTSGRR